MKEIVRCESLSAWIECKTESDTAYARSAIASAVDALKRHDVYRLGRKMVVDGYGNVRRMTILERLAVWLLGGKLEVRP